MAERYNTQGDGLVYANPPSECPRCHCGIFPEELFAAKSEDQEYGYTTDIVFRCPVCGKIFSTEYMMDGNSNCIAIIGNYPLTHKEEEFSAEIKELSPKFCKIYNESLYAEHEQLSEIVGMGYRKSLEFLIKDFAISLKPDKKDKIIENWLGQCIKEYIDDKRIQKLAEKASWLGNDESHFLKQYDDLDTIEMMKYFIKAIVNFIEACLAVKKAENIEKKD